LAASLTAAFTVTCCPSTAPNGELEAIPRTRNTQSRSRGHQRCEHRILREVRPDHFRVRREIEHAPQARDDRRQRREPWKLDRRPKRVPLAGSHRHRPAHAGDLDRARIPVA
jgi:hypothetical protein